MNEWSNFFVAMAGAAAALTGLIFVGISISLSRILSIPQLATRASQSIILLLTVLIMSALCLVPGQTASGTGIEIIIIGTAIWLISLTLDISILRRTEAAYKLHSIRNIIFTQVSVLPYIIAGIITLMHGYRGIYWLIPAILISFIKAIIEAWVLLVEIHR